MNKLEIIAAIRNAAKDIGELDSQKIKRRSAMSLVDHEPGTNSAVIAWINNERNSQAGLLLNEVLKLILRKYDKADQNIAEQINRLCDRLEQSLCNEPISMVDQARREALKHWEQAHDWEAVNAKLGRSPDKRKATEMELKRFAKKNSIVISPGKTGRKKAD